MTRQECKDIPKQLQRKVPQEVVQEECSLVPRTQCQEVQVQVPERKCRQVTTNVCQVILFPVLFTSISGPTCSRRCLGPSVGP